MASFKRRRRKQRKDNAKWAGQRRAVQKLSKPKPVEIPQVMK